MRNRPVACNNCGLINWPDHMDGSARTHCHKCGAELMLCGICGRSTDWLSNEHTLVMACAQCNRMVAKANS